MPPSGECLHRITPAAAMVDKYIENTQNTNKKLFLPSNYSTNWSLIVYENYIPQKGPSTHVLGATTPDPNPNATIQVEELGYISSSQTLSADKN